MKCHCEERSDEAISKKGDCHALRVAMTCNNIYYVIYSFTIEKASPSVVNKIIEKANEIEDKEEQGEISEDIEISSEEQALKHNATSVILEHNHPCGLPEPTDNDNRLTDAVKKALSTVDISLQEHVIISDDGFFSYRKNGYFDMEGF